MTVTMQPASLDLAPLAPAWPDSAGPAPRWGTPRSPERPTFGEVTGRIAVELGMPLRPWQQQVCDVALEVMPDGSWAYETVVLIVPRQAGKSALFAPLVVQRCVMSEKPRSVWLTAQKGMKAVARWKSVRNQVKRSPYGDPTISKSKVSQAFEVVEFLRNGSTFQPFAPDEEAMHGETPHLVLTDEMWAFSLSQKRLLQAGYRPPMLLARGQEWLVSAAGTARSEWLKDERRRGRHSVAVGERRRVAFFEWCLPDDVGGVPLGELPDEALIEAVMCHHPASLDHPANRARAGGELEGWVTREVLRAAIDDRADFLRAWGGLDDDGASDDTVIPWAAFEAARGERIPEGVRLGLGVEVDPESREISLAAGWRGPDGVARVDLVVTREGTRWLAPLVAGLDPTFVGTVAVNNVGPGRDVADQLEAAGVEVLRVPAGDYAAACRRFDDGIQQDGSVSWTDDGVGHLAQALRGSSWRRLPSGGRVWGAVGSEPVTALPSVTLAVWAADHLPEESAELPPFRIW